MTYAVAGMALGGMFLGAYNARKDRKAQEESEAEARRQAYLQNMNDADRVRLSPWLPGGGANVPQRTSVEQKPKSSEFKGALQGGFAGLSQGMNYNAAVNQNEMLKAKTAEASANAALTNKKLAALDTPDYGEEFVADSAWNNVDSGANINPRRDNYPTPKHISQGLNPQGKSLMNKQFPNVKSDIAGDRSLWDRYEGQTLDPSRLRRANREVLDDTQRGYTFGSPKYF